MELATELVSKTMNVSLEMTRKAVDESSSEG
jgi:hypothetical protein